MNLRFQVVHILLILVGVGTSCRDEGSGTQGSVEFVPAEGRLEELQRFGVFEPDPADSVPAGGGALGQIAKAVDDPEGNVYVLDAGFKKIAVFGPSGDLKRVILGGHGEGPGEFLHPTSLWLTESGTRLAVFDYSLNRVTTFDTLGAVLETFTVPRAKDIALINDLIIGTHMPNRNWVIWAYSTRTGELRDSVHLDPDHLDFYPRGSIARLGIDIAGNPVIGHHRPGLFLPSGSQSDEFLGTELLPGARSKRFEGIDASPGATFGIGRLGDGTFVVAYLVRDLSSNDRPGPSEQFVELLSAGGERLTRIPLENQQVTSFSVSRDGQSLLLAVANPFPQVVRYRVLHAPGP